MRLHWPKKTAPPAPDGLFWVVKGTRASEPTWQFLKAPKGPQDFPWWTPERAAAGIWPVADAERLVTLHRPLQAEAHSARRDPGEAPEVWAEWIGPPDETDLEARKP